MQLFGYNRSFVMLRKLYFIEQLVMLVSIDWVISVRISASTEFCEYRNVLENVKLFIFIL